MVLGLFLALATVAALWSIIGIGNALVEHEISQEAADSAAFTNAVVHARGMNLIAFINIVMMVMTMLYLALSWLDMLLSVLILVTGTWTFGPNHCIYRYLSWLAEITVNWCQIANRLERVEKPLFRADENVFRAMKRIGPPLFEVQVWAAQIVPYLGTTAATTTAAEYGRPLTLSFGLSNFPGGGAIRPLNNANVVERIPFLNRRRPGERPDANVLQDRRIGLPVEAEAANSLCVAAARFPIDAALLALQEASATAGTASLTTKEPIASIISTLSQAAGEINKAYLCQDKARGNMPRHRRVAEGADRQRDLLETFANAFGMVNNELMRFTFQVGMLPMNSRDKFYLAGDYFWKMNWPNPMGRQGLRNADGFLAGPKKVVGYAYNGNDWMQVWAFTYGQQEQATEASRIVSMPVGLFRRAVPRPADSQETPSHHRFVAQAEFYFDCTGTWQSAHCNRAGLAMYRMRWRARLRRVHNLNYLGSALELFLNNALNSPVLGDYIGRVTQPFLAATLNTIKGLPQTFVNHEVLQPDGRSDDYLH